MPGIIGLLTEAHNGGLWYKIVRFSEPAGPALHLLSGSVLTGAPQNSFLRPMPTIRERWLFEGRMFLSEKHTAKLTILVVEDDMIVRFTIAEFLRSADCEVVEAATGEAAVTVLQQRNGIDAVFTDIQLGGPVSGWDVGDVSRATHPTIPVVYTSGAAVINTRLVPGSVFLGKPYDPAAVLTACQTLLESR
jgi:CheY-like chemotaxis protein